MDISEGEKESRSEDAKRQAKPKRIRHGTEKSFGSKEETALPGSKKNKPNRDRQCCDNHCKPG